MSWKLNLRRAAERVRTDALRGWQVSPHARRPVRFAIVATPRTGSTWLVDQLHRPPETICYSEMFIKSSGATFPTFAGAKDVELWNAPGRPAHRFDRLREPIAIRRYLQRLFTAPPATRAVGLKVMYQDAAEHPTLLPTLRLMGVKVIHLRRDNLLDIAISQTTRASRKNKSHSPVDELPEDSQLPFVEITSLMDYLSTMSKRTDQMKLILNAMRFASIHVTYEDLVAGRSWDQISALLSSPILPGASSLSRVSDGDRRQRVANWHDIVSELTGTPHERFL